MTAKKKAAGTDAEKALAYSVISSANTFEDGALIHKHRNVKGMSMLVTCLFIVGETAGGGLIALPSAMVNAGIFGGIIILALVAFASTYTGGQLSENWTILQQRWPEYRHHCRAPYPAMAHRSLGPMFGTLMSICLDVTQFGTAVVFMLLAAKNIENFLHSYGGTQVGFCQILIFVAIFMLPFTMLKSPKDFWWAVMLAMFTTTVAVCLIVYGAIEDYTLCSKSVQYQKPTLGKMFMSFGTVVFAYGGHGAFPTIQHDMKEPYKFSRSVQIAFLIICLMYLPVCFVGYYTYGDSLLDTIIPSIQNPQIQQAVNVLITLHVILALTIVFNPLNQEFEDLLKVPQEFGWQRVASRTGMMILVVLVAETVPNFGPLLDLVGGSTITLMALIFPCIFNLYLCAAAVKHKNEKAFTDEARVTFAEIFRYTKTRKLVLNFAVIVCAFIGGTAATVSAVQAMMTSEFSAPCYASYFTGVVEEVVAPVMESHGKYACCGAFRNISRLGMDYCLDISTYVGGGHG